MAKSQVADDRRIGYATAFGVTCERATPMSTHAQSTYAKLPYRPCAGLMVLNRSGLAFIGRRIGGPEHIDRTHVWQLPQGGIDAGEEAWPAALRELREETNITSVDKLGEIGEWLKYDIPPAIAGRAWSGKYRGQTQKWFALRFTGDEKEIDIEHPAGGHEPEFVEWRWEPLKNLPDLVVPFKRAVYERVVAEFKKFV
jgi:putative (di)nucleoside polyphosphate hydrolase